MTVSPEQLATWRRHLHSHPELSFHEEETARYIEGELQAMGLLPRRIAKTGVAVDIPLGSAGRAVAVRADIDALPLTEQTGLPFSSRRAGVMHACGHDGHTAIALGVARRLASLAAARGRAPADGQVRMLFQPAEETPPGGALDMIRDGALEGIDAVIGLHLWSPLPVGKAMIAAGPVTANADLFEVDITGAGGHGALPHDTVDAVTVACDLVGRIQTIVSRRADPLEPVVVTVGALHAGTTHNIIAGSARLLGTARTISESARRTVRAELERLCAPGALLHGARAELRFMEGYPAVVNHEAETQLLADVCAGRLGASAVQTMRPLMVGEDFAYYLRERPGAFLFLGAGDRESGAAYPHHHPRFTIAEEALLPGVDILTETALRLLRA